MSTFKHLGSYVTIPKGTETTWPLPQADLYEFTDNFWEHLDAGDAWFRETGVDTIWELREWIKHYRDALIRLAYGIEWALVLPDARTIADDISIGVPDLSQLLERLDGLESRLRTLEEKPDVLVPTLDSLTSEAQNRKAEIAEAWLGLLGDIMTLET